LAAADVFAVGLRLAGALRLVVVVFFVADFGVAFRVVFEGDLAFVAVAAGALEGAFFAAGLAADLRAGALFARPAFTDVFDLAAAGSAVSFAVGASASTALAAASRSSKLSCRHSE